MITVPRFPMVFIIMLVLYGGCIVALLVHAWYNRRGS